MSKCRKIELECFVFMMQIDCSKTECSYINEKVSTVTNSSCVWVILIVIIVSIVHVIKMLC